MTPDAGWGVEPHPPRPHPSDTYGHLFRADRDAFAELVSLPEPPAALEA